MMIVKTLSEHIKFMVILHFGQSIWFLNKTKLISQNDRSFQETAVIGTENTLWKYELDRNIFLDSTGIGNLKNKELRVSGAKHFWGVYKHDDRSLFYKKNVYIYMYAI